MTVTRVRIDLKKGIIEAEGDADFVKAVYRDFRERLVAGNVSGESSSKSLGNGQRSKKSKVKPEQAKSKAKPKPKGKSVSGGSASGKLVNDLDLSGGGKTESLKEFFTKHNLKTNYERNLVFVYYLQHRLKTEDITIDHVFTCYRHVKVKVPNALQQSLWDTSKHKGWIDTSSGENITVTVSGMNYLEHDLPKSGDE